jgi:hypothetical protein
MGIRELLLAICETPGWAPNEPSSIVERSLAELNANGWIMPRLDGWEATPAALDAYPDFRDEGDLENPNWVRAARELTPPPLSESESTGVQEVGLDYRLVIGAGQRVRSPIDVSYFGGDLTGFIELEYDSLTLDRRRRVEVEVRLRVRNLSHTTNPEVEP